MQRRGPTVFFSGSKPSLGEGVALGTQQYKSSAESRERGEHALGVGSQKLPGVAPRSISSGWEGGGNSLDSAEVDWRRQVDGAHSTAWRETYGVSLLGAFKGGNWEGGFSVHVETTGVQSAYPRGRGNLRRAGNLLCCTPGNQKIGKRPVLQEITIFKKMRRSAARPRENWRHVLRLRGGDLHQRQGNEGRQNHLRREGGKGRGLGSKERGSTPAN